MPLAPNDNKIRQQDTVMSIKDMLVLTEMTEMTLCWSPVDDKDKDFVVVKKTWSSWSMVAVARKSVLSQPWASVAETS